MHCPLNVRLEEGALWPDGDTMPGDKERIFFKEREASMKATGTRGLGRYQATFKKKGQPHF